ncbi:hypothetical protein [Deinococcus peraridilitoris]|uniref:Lipoprotein n=1 Tax=Deinococcus peraridilitoris (strain DSM 19664 / LMG 22246 / CIP 109416 / KR-200) TaxID=937777 RepID=L0A8R1_DEIPD|nr:hypothetical protein [Deinococcus peraridilitoris]AFZ69460.1 hypothetical protein Deipe_4082 [Deinococcus peraridilitoris DSM 19664]
MKKLSLLAFLFPVLAACAIGKSEGPPVMRIVNSNQQTTQSTRVALYLNGVQQPSLVVPPQKNVFKNLPAGQVACIIVEETTLGYRFTVKSHRNSTVPYVFELNADGQMVTEFSQGYELNGATPTTSCP